MISVRRLDPPYWALTFPFSRAVIAVVKSTPGMRFDFDDKRLWIGYADAVATAVDRLRKAGMRVNGNVEIGPATTPLLVADTGREYQRVGIEFLLAKAKEGCILADEMAVGKSAQAAVAARALKLKTVVVCPNFGRGVWLDPDKEYGELARWWPAAKVRGLSGTKPQSIDNGEAVDVVVIHYDILYAWVDALVAWGVKVLIIDEIHYAMSSGSRRSKALASLAASCVYRIGLTGTPMTSRPKDLWAPVDILSPGRFGKFFNYAVNYCEGHQEQVTPTKCVWKFDGASNLDELNRRLAYTPETPWGFMLRRLKSDVALELPAKTRQVLELTAPRKIRFDALASLSSNAALRQSLNAAADEKFPQVIDLVVAHLEAGHKVVVGAYRRAIAEMIRDGVLQRLPIRGEIITGDVAIVKRHEIIKSQPELLCATLDSTAAAINLSYASVGVVAELVWVPSTLSQWEARFGRQPGKNVLIQYPILKGSVESLIKRVLISKLDNFQKAIGKTDDKLAADLRGIEKTGAQRLLELYERLKAET